MTTDQPMDTAATPSRLDRLRARYRWLDHAVRTQQRYTESQGNFYAAGLTYFTIFSLFPLLMVGFATGGFVLSRRPDLLARIEERIRGAVTGSFSQQLIELMDSAIQSRTSVGVIGLGVAGWAGLTWMSHLREALSQMWEPRSEPGGFVGNKLSDLLALISAFGAIIVTIALTTLGDPKVMAAILGWLGVPDFGVLGVLLRIGSLAMSLVVSWLLFSLMIARLPRQSTGFTNSIRAGLIAAVGFEVFKQVASIYLRSVLNSPAGVTFGPVLGLMMFAYVTGRLLLLATAWAAVAEEELAPGVADTAAQDAPARPVPAVARGYRDDGPGGPQLLAAAAAGAIGALGISVLTRRRRKG